MAIFDALKTGQTFVPMGIQQVPMMNIPIIDMTGGYGKQKATTESSGTKSDKSDLTGMQGELSGYNNIENVVSSLENTHKKEVLMMAQKEAEDTGKSIYEVLSDPSSKSSKYYVQGKSAVKKIQNTMNNYVKPLYKQDVTEWSDINKSLKELRDNDYMFKTDDGLYYAKQKEDGSFLTFGDLSYQVYFDDKSDDITKGYYNYIQKTGDKSTLGALQYISNSVKNLVVSTKDMPDTENYEGKLQEFIDDVFSSSGSSASANTGVPGERVLSADKRSVVAVNGYKAWVKSDSKGNLSQLAANAKKVYQYLPEDAKKDLSHKVFVDMKDGSIYGLKVRSGNKDINVLYEDKAYNGKDKDEKYEAGELIRVGNKYHKLTDIGESVKKLQMVGYDVNRLEAEDRDNIRKLNNIYLGNILTEEKKSRKTTDYDISISWLTDKDYKGGGSGSDDKGKLNVFELLQAGGGDEIEINIPITGSTGNTYGSNYRTSYVDFNSSSEGIKYNATLDKMFIAGRGIYVNDFISDANVVFTGNGTGVDRDKFSNIVGNDAWVIKVVSGNIAPQEVNSFKLYDEDDIGDIVDPDMEDVATEVQEFVKLNYGGNSYKVFDTIAKTYNKIEGGNMSGKDLYNLDKDQLTIVYNTLDTDDAKRKIIELTGDEDRGKTLKLIDKMKKTLELAMYQADNPIYTYADPNNGTVDTKQYTTIEIALTENAANSYLANFIGTKRGQGIGRLDLDIGDIETVYDNRNETVIKALNNIGYIGKKIVGKTANNNGTTYYRFKITVDKSNESIPRFGQTSSQVLDMNYYNAVNKQGEAVGNADNALSNAIININ